MPAITFPTAALNTSTFSPVSLGKCYIGTVDTNPRVLGNRINVTLTQQDGTPVVIAPAQQPFILNSSGMFTYGGSVVTLQTTVPYSMAVDNAQDSPIFYAPNSSTEETSAPII